MTVEDFLERVRGSISHLRQRRLGERAVAAGYITVQQFEQALRETHGDLGPKLVERGWMTRSDLERLKGTLDDPAPAPSGMARYELGEKLGEGAMSVVHRARDKQLGRDVAVKILRESFVTHPIVRERFTREAQTLARLDHPNVVKVFDAGADGAGAWLVMELVPGEPLSRILKSKPRDEARILRLLEKVARGIHHAHEKGVIHRDLKPENILVTAGDEPKVADFGLAHLMESAPALTRSGTVLGTPMYMAPEQVEGGKEITPRTDVYALGAILYESLCGRPPHTGATIPEVYAHIAHDDPEPPRKSNPGLAWEPEAIALKALERNPSRRYATAEAFAEDLRRYREGEPITARPVSAASLLWKKTVKAKAVVIPLVLAALAAAGVLAAWTRKERKAEAEREALRLLEAARPPLEKATAALYRGEITPADMLSFAGSAESLAARALDRAPDLPLGHYRLGEARELRGDYAAAQQCFARAAELDPRFGSARYRLGRVMLWRAFGASLYSWPDLKEVRWAEAEKLVQQGILEIEAAQVSGFDNDLQREIASAMLAYLRGEKQKVHAICREGIRRFGKKEGVEEFHWLLGLVLDSKAAQKKSFDEALTLRPKFPLALYARAATHDAEVEAGIEDYSRAIAISPGFGEAYLNRGSLLWRKGDAAGAYADFDQLIRMGQLLPGAYNGRGRTALDLMNDPERALPDLNEAIRLAPDNYVLPWLARAKARLLRKEYDLAIADATKAIEISSWGEMFYIRGRARLARGDRAGAITDLEEGSKRGMTPEMRSELQGLIDQAKPKP